MVLGSDGLLLSWREPRGELRDRHLCPLCATGTPSKHPQGGHSSVAFEHPQVRSSKRGLKTTLVASDCVKKLVELRQRGQDFGYLRLAGLGFELMSEVGAVKSRIFGIEFELGEFDLDEADRKFASINNDVWNVALAFPRPAGRGLGFERETRGERLRLA
jgi:hypothetical protein